MNNINGLPDVLFSPLSKDYCLYFYLMTIFSFIILIITVIMVISRYIMTKGKSGLWDAFSVVPILLSYFHSRLLYSICIN
jgi:hypothetical protein